MKCLYCDKEMVYKPNMRGYGSRGENYNELVIDYLRYVENNMDYNKLNELKAKYGDVEKDYIICKRKIKRHETFSFMPQYYVCPKCGLVLQKIPDAYINGVINAEW